MNEPTNRELQIIIDNQKTTFMEKHEDVMRILREVRDDVKTINAQAQKTTSQVDLHTMLLADYPKQIEKLTDVVFWKKYVLIAMSILWSVLLIGVPFLIRYINNQIHTTVVDSLEQFDFQFPK